MRNNFYIRISTNDEELYFYCNRLEVSIHPIKLNRKKHNKHLYVSALRDGTNMLIAGACVINGKGTKEKKAKIKVDISSDKDRAARLLQASDDEIRKILNGNRR